MKQLTAASTLLNYSGVLAWNVHDADELTFIRRTILFTAETTLYISGGRYASIELDRRLLNSSTSKLLDMKQLFVISNDLTHCKNMTLLCKCLYDADDVDTDAYLWNL